MNEEKPYHPDQRPQNKMNEPHTPLQTGKSPVNRNSESQNDTKDQRVSEVIGDRTCAACGFNLFAQPILREHHYNMLIVRCPECGTVAALQEYPLLGKWANRWSKLLAAFWLLIIFGGLIASGDLISSFSNSVANESVYPFAAEIGKLFQPYRLQHPELYGKGTQYANWYNGFEYKTDADFIYSYIDRSWWEDSGQSQLQDSSSRKIQYDWSAVFQPRYVYLSLFLIGIIWSVIMIGATRKSLIVALLVMGLLAWAVIILTNEWSTPALNYWRGNITNAQTLAAELKEPPIRLLLVAWLLIPLAIGMLFGRPIVRFLVIALYPPRMRGWLAFLWIADGKTPPQKTWLDR